MKADCVSGPLLRLGDLLGASGGGVVRCLRQDADRDRPVLPAMPVGERSLALFGLRDELCGRSSGELSAWLFGFEGVSVTSGAGIIGCDGRFVVEDTRDHTVPARDGYAIGADGVCRLPRVSASLSGRWISLLLGAPENYFHYFLMNLARLFILTPEEMESADGILLPKLTQGWQRDLLRLFCARFPMLREKALRSVPDGVSVGVEELLLPWGTVDAGGFVHSGAVAVAGSVRPRRRTARVAGSRIYIDRRQSSVRVLENEDALVAALEAYEFVPVRLEALSVAEQIACFAEAEVIVAPHGAGLSNLVFCRPGTRVVEIMPDRLLRWGYRDIAAQRGMQYDCVISRSRGTDAVTGTVLPHCVAVPHVISALAGIQ